MRVLILGGTTEASAIAQALAGDGRFDPVLSLAGRTRAPVPPPIPWRIGGFGGAPGLAAYLQDNGVEALVDATHPFASRMKQNAQCVEIPRVVVMRPAWRPEAGDRWTEVATMADAAAGLGPAPRRVFLTVGRGELGLFRGPHVFLVRSVDAPFDAPPGATIITARGPFTMQDELALLRTHQIDTLVTKNSGGEAVAGKLAAARALGATVVMVARPPAPRGPIVPHAAGALAWLHAQAALRGV